MLMLNFIYFVNKLLFSVFHLKKIGDFNPLFHVATFVVRIRLKFHFQELQKMPNRPLVSEWMLWSDVSFIYFGFF